MTGITQTIGKQETVTPITMSLLNVLGVCYFFGAQGLAIFGAHGLPAFLGAHGFIAFPLLGAHGFMLLLLWGAQGFADCADAGSGVAATKPPIAAIELNVCNDFLSVDIAKLSSGVGFRPAFTTASLRPPANPAWRASMRPRRSCRGR